MQFRQAGRLDARLFRAAFQPIVSNAPIVMKPDTSRQAEQRLAEPRGRKRMVSGRLSLSIGATRGGPAELERPEIGEPSSMLDVTYHMTPPPIVHSITPGQDLIFELVHGASSLIG